MFLYHCLDTGKLVPYIHIDFSFAFNQHNLTIHPQRSQHGTIIYFTNRLRTVWRQGAESRLRGGNGSRWKNIGVHRIVGVTLPVVNKGLRQRIQEKIGKIWTCRITKPRIVARGDHDKAGAGRCEHLR